MGRTGARFAALAAGGLACVLAPAARAAEQAKPFTLQRLGEGVWGAVARPGGGAGSNAAFVLGDDGVAVVDTFQSADAARDLLAAIRARTSLPVRFVVDTHYHLDHVAGNGVFRDAGAVIAAQRNVRAWERVENLKWWGDEVPEAAKKLVRALVLPELTYDDGIDLWLGKRRLVVRALPGHTGSDSVVIVPDAGVVLAGDLFWNRTLPNTTDADTAAWIATIGRLVADHPDDVFLPGHGEPGGVGDVRAFGGYLRALRDEVAGAMAAGRSGDSLVESVLPRLREDYGDWAFFGHFAKDNVVQTEAEERGVKRTP